MRVSNNEPEAHMSRAACTVNHPIDSKLYFLSIGDIDFLDAEDLRGEVGVLGAVFGTSY